MRPPILQGKIVLALVAFLAVGVALGSALGPETNRGSAGGWASYTPTPVHSGQAVARSVLVSSSPVKMTPKERRAECARLKAAVSKMPKSSGHGFDLLCVTHR